MLTTFLMVGIVFWPLWGALICGFFGKYLGRQLPNWVWLCLVVPGTCCVLLWLHQVNSFYWVIRYLSFFCGWLTYEYHYLGTLHWWEYSHHLCHHLFDNWDERYDGLLFYCAKYLRASSIDHIMIILFQWSSPFVAWKGAHLKVLFALYLTPLMTLQLCIMLCGFALGHIVILLHLYHLSQEKPDYEFNSVIYTGFLLFVFWELFDALRPFSWIYWQV